MTTLFLDLAPATYGRVVDSVHGLPSGPGRTERAMAVLAQNFDGRSDMVFIRAEAAEMTWEDAREEPFDP